MEATKCPDTSCPAYRIYQKYAQTVEVAKNIKPVDDIVIAVPIQLEKVSRGGIIIPETADAPITGVVVAMGPGKLLKDGSRKPMDVKLGDKILFSKHANLDMKVDGEHMKIVREDSIVGIITD
jgi:chaperonin GroES